jgi:muconolactone delta-isomerase
MKMLAMEHEVAGVSEEAFTPELLKEESRRAWELYQSGILREIYFRADRPEAVLVLECESVGDAHNLLGTLPLVREGLIAFDLIPLAPYPGFGRLFAGGRTASSDVET